MGRKKNMTLRHVLKLGEPKSRLYRFDQWNDIFRYWSIPVYRFKFIIIYIYIYKTEASASTTIFHVSIIQYLKNKK